MSLFCVHQRDQSLYSMFFFVVFTTLLLSFASLIIYIYYSSTRNIHVYIFLNGV